MPGGGGEGVVWRGGAVRVCVEEHREHIAYAAAPERTKGVALPASIRPAIPLPRPTHPWQCW